MGNQQSIIAAEAHCASSKEQVNRAVDDFVAFIQHTGVEIDEDIEDLGNELAVLSAAFKESAIIKGCGVEDHDRLVAEVEKHINGQKHSIRKLFAYLQESADIFEDMASTIVYDSESDEDSDDNDDDDDESIDDAIAESDEEDVDELLYASSNDGEDSENAEDEDKKVDDAIEEGSETSFESYEEDVGDDDVLQLCRFAASDMVSAYEDELKEINLPESIISKRVTMLREMVYTAAECAVQDAVTTLVDSVRVAALEDIDTILCLAMGQGVFANADGEALREMLCEIIAVGAVARQTLEDLPFTRRDEIYDSQECIINCVEGHIRDTQLKVSDKPDVLEYLMDLDIDDYGDDYSDDEIDPEAQEPAMEIVQQPAEPEEIEAPKPTKAKTPKKVVEKVESPKKVIEKVESPKKAPTPKKQDNIEPAAAKADKADSKGSKRKATAEPAQSSPPKRASRSRKA